MGRRKVFLRALTLALMTLAGGAQAHAVTVNLGPGRDPAAAVDAQGTAYLAWNGTQAGTTTLHVCRLPRGGMGCTAGGLVAAPGTSLTRPFVTVDGAVVRLVSFRFGEGVPGFSAVYLFESTNGGASFGPGRRVGTQSFRTAVAGPGAGISLVSSADGAGGRYQRVPVDGSPQTDVVATLSTTHLNLGAVGLLDAVTPVVVFSDGAGNGLSRRHLGAGDVNDVRNWGPAQDIGPASNSHLAGGPRGLFLLSTPGGGRLELRRHTGATFTPPVPLPDGAGETPSSHLTQDPGGRLHAVWPRLTGAGMSLQYAGSEDGLGFTRQTVLDGREGIFDLRAAVAADHVGVATWQTAAGSDSELRVAPIPGTPAADLPADTQPPDTTITAGPDQGAVVATAPTFEFESSEPGSRFECSLKPSQLDQRDGPTWAPCTTPYQAPGRSFTAIAFLVRAIDAAGNVDPTPARREYISDPEPYGNMRVRGIDVYQLVQPNSAARMFSYSAAAPGASQAFPSFCGGGTPTDGTLLASGPGAGRLCQSGASSRRVAYRGVPLDTAKPATAVVYADMAGALSSDPAQPLDVTLTATAPNGRRIGPTLVQRITNPPRTGTSFVTAFERRNAIGQRYGVTFAMPAAWMTTIDVNLTATVAFAPGTRSWNEAECFNNACGSDNTFELRGVKKVSLPPVIIKPLFLRSASSQIVPTTFPLPESVFDVVRHVVPGGERIRLGFYGETLDITRQAGLTASQLTIPLVGTIWACDGRPYGRPTDTAQAQATRSCRFDAVGMVVDQWVADNPPRYTGADGRLVEAYDIAAGVINYAGEPGWQWGGTIRDVGRTTVADVPRLTLACCTRPLTAATHEVLHALTAPHAGQDCPVPQGQPGNLTGPGAGQTGEVWAGDDTGRLQGTRFDRRQAGAPHFAGDGAATLFDLMSYCAANSDSAEAATDATRGDAWISPRNWNRVVTELLAFRQRAGRGVTLGRRPRPRVAARRAAAPRTSFAVGQAGPLGGRILRVVPPDGADLIPRSDPASPLRLRSLAADGRVLLDAGVRTTVSSEAPARLGGTFVAPVAGGAAAVELVRDGTVLDRLQRGGAPRLSLRSPTAGTRVTERGALEVRWSASDPDRDALYATVEYSPDGGRTWRTVHAGPSTGSATLRGNALPGSRRARVRVTVNDGFTEVATRSAAFRVAGRRPDVKITAPQRGHLLQAGIPVRLTAVTSDARGVPLASPSVRWFAGRRALGRGSELTARLPAGRVTLRVVGRDADGRVGTASIRLTVAPNPLRLLRLDAPRTVRAGARTVTVRIASSAPARLRAGGRSYLVGTRVRPIVLRLPARPRTGVVRVPFQLVASSGGGGRVTGRVEVFRGRPSGRIP